MKPFVASSILVLVLLLVAGPQQAQAQRIRLEAAPTLGYGLNVPNQVGDIGSLSIGVQGHLYLRQRRFSIILNPAFEYYLFDIDGVSGLQVDGNVLLGLGTPRSVLMPYVGLGIALTSVSGSDAFSQISEGTNVGLNLIGGFRFGDGPIHPFFQGRFTIGSHDLYFTESFDPDTASGFGVQGGILFLLSR